MPLALRTPDDVKRLFSALGDPLTHESGGFSLASLDETGLNELGEGDSRALLLNLAVAAAVGWSAINAYERNARSIGWGLTWAGVSYFFPISSVIYTGVRNMRG